MVLAALCCTRHTPACSAPERWLLNTLPHRLHADGRTRAPRRGRRVERQWCHSGKGERHGRKLNWQGDRDVTRAAGISWGYNKNGNAHLSKCALWCGEARVPTCIACGCNFASPPQFALGWRRRRARRVLGTASAVRRNACWRPAESRRSFVLQPLVRPHGTHTHVHTTNTRVASGGPSELNAR